jgi:hypothetical protein
MIVQNLTAPRPSSSSVSVRDASAALQLGVSEVYALRVPADAAGTISLTAATQVGWRRARGRAGILGCHRVLPI